MSRIRAELLRKSVHVAMGGFALLLRWLTPGQAALLAVAALVFNVLVLHRLTRRALLREGERARAFSWGIVLYPAAVLGLIVVFRERLELAAAGWALLAFGDGMATVAGVLLGGPRLPWNPDKSWAGFAAFVVYGTVTSAFLVLWVQQAALDAALAGRPAPHWIGGAFFSGSGAGEMPPLALLLVGCGAAALAAAFAESLRSGVDDNVLVPLVGGAVLRAADAVDPARLVAAAPLLGSRFLWGAAINTVLAIAARAAGGVGLSGALVGWGIGVGLFVFAGWRGFLMLFVFFVLGTATTKIGYRTKAALGIAQARGGRRGARNAVANAGAGLACAFLAAATTQRELFELAMVAAFATATCDTVSSEIGQAFGRRHYLVTTFRRVPAGTDGAVSVEGTLAGIAGAALLAGTAWAIGLVSLAGALVATFAAWAGATLESYLGATLERRRIVDNEVVNFANTVAGALTACWIWIWL